MLGFLAATLQALGVNTTTRNRDVILNSDVIVLATKPHQVLGIMTEIQAMFSDFQSQAQPHISNPKSWRPLIVSVASSVTIADIEEKVCGLLGQCNNETLLHETKYFWSMWHVSGGTLLHEKSIMPLQCMGMVRHSFFTL